MLEVLAFMLVITNPLGTPATLGYPNVAYEQYSASNGHVVAYSSMQECVLDRADIITAERKRLSSTPTMPEYKRVLTNRLESLACLPKDAKPAPQARTLVTTPEYTWRIGRIGIEGTFKGQSLDMRHFNNYDDCINAKVALFKRIDAIHPAQDYEFRKLYHCYKVRFEAPTRPYKLTLTSY